MQTPDLVRLTRREREILDILYRRGRATASEILSELSEAPSYSAVRALLRLLEERGHIQHEEDGPRYVYLPRVPRDEARRSALDHVISTFFDGSVEDAVATLLDSKHEKLGPTELGRIAKLIRDAKKEGR